MYVCMYVYKSYIYIYIHEWSSMLSSNILKGLTDAYGLTTRRPPVRPPCLVNFQTHPPPTERWRQSLLWRPWRVAVGQTWKMTTWSWTVARKRRVLGGPVVGFHRRGTLCHSTVAQTSKAVLEENDILLWVTKVRHIPFSKLLLDHRKGWLYNQQLVIVSIILRTCSITLEFRLMELVRRYTWGKHLSERSRLVSRHGTSSHHQLLSTSLHAR